MSANYRLSPQQAQAIAATHGDTKPLLLSAECEFSSALDVHRIAKVIEKEIQQLEILRTHIQDIDGLQQPAQTVSEPECVEALPEIEELNNAGRAVSATFPGVLFTKANSNHVWSFTISSVLLDAQSIGLLCERIATILSGNKEEGEVLQYPDISQWELEILEDPDSTDGRNYWDQKELVDDFDCRWILDTSDSTSFPTTKNTHTISTHLRKKVQEFCQENKISRESFYLSIWSSVLAKHSEQSVISLGIESDGRAFDELRDAIGLLARELPISLDVDDSAPIVARCQKVEQALASHRDVQEYFGGSDVMRINSAGFAWRDVQGLTGGGDPAVFVKKIDVVQGPGTIRLHVNEYIGQTDICLAVDESKVMEDIAEIWLAQYMDALEEAVDLAAEDASQFSLLPKDHQEHLEKVLGQGPFLTEPDRTVLEDFIEQAHANPNSVAIRYGSEVWTYQQTNAFANQIAEYVSSNGPKQIQRVALYIERSPEMIAAILGVLKAGACYIPIDPSYPAERVDFLLEDSGAEILLTNHQPTNIRVPANARVFTLAEIGPAKQALAQYEPDVLPQLNDPAYVIYTSGSTGEPKGVVIDHRNLASSTNARSQYYSKDPKNFLLLSSYAFDSSIAGIFWTLKVGGTLILPQHGEERDPGKLLDYIRANQVDTLLTLPSLYQLLIDQAIPEMLKSLQTVIVAGEICVTKLVTRHFEEVPDCTFFNEYGPTEATVWSTVWQAERSKVPVRVPIGQAIPGASIYVLGTNGNTVPWGTVGEIYIGGPGVAKGYLEKPQLTDESFCNNPVAEGRLYRTGDLVCFNPNGELEFVGRKDHQVKLRGYRIELGEIEHVLSSLHQISEAIVVVTKKLSTADSLVAFFTAVGQVDLESMRINIAAKLPAHMVPTKFVQLEKIPRTPNGKVDRDSLSELDLQDFSVNKEVVPPSTSIEKVLCGMWAELLEQEIGITDNIFEQGATSLLVAQLAARLREYLEYNFHIRVLFDNPTVAGLAHQMENDPEQGERLSEVATLLLEIVDDVRPSETG